MTRRSTEAGRLGRLLCDHLDTAGLFHGPLNDRGVLLEWLRGLE